MMPAGPLMIEHRLIERVVKLWKKELESITKNNAVDMCFIEFAVDFMKTYADRCHHGKEEDILFRDLKKKDLSSELKRILDELIHEHGIARKTVATLVDAKGRYASENRDSLSEMVPAIKKLIELYPSHIEKEDRHFFLPCMKYFNAQEQAAMLEEFWIFDRKLFHERYKSLVASFEKLTSCKN